MGRFSRSWHLIKSSAYILRQDKELMVFPVLSGLAMILLALSFILPIFGPGFVEYLADPDLDPESERLLLALVFLFYVLSYFIVVFFNAAIVACAMIRMDGGDPTVKDGLDAAVDRLPQIFLWALFAGTVGFVLSMIEERSRLAGRIITGLFGIAWTVTTYLAVPVLVDRRLGPIEAFRESAVLLKRTWGEQIIGGVGMGLIYLVALLPAFALIAFGVFVGMEAGLAAAIVLAVVYLLVIAVAFSAIQVIYQTALYRYADRGEVPGGFDREALAGAIQHKPDLTQ